MKPGKSRKGGHNVVELATKKKALAQTALGAKVLPHLVQKASIHRPKTDAQDERVKEAMRLAQAFLAIEDAEARGALIALAERLVSYDWIRKVK